MSASILSTTRTGIGNTLQGALYMGLPYEILPKSTLNEAYNIQPGVLPTKTPTIKYICFGNRGHAPSTMVSGIPVTKPYKHLPTHGGLYGPLPFVLRALDNDLTQTERAKYALRKIMTVGSTNYIAYYLRRLDLSRTVQTLKILTKNQGTVTASTFQPSDATLAPTPTTLSSQEVNVLTAQTLEASALVPLVFTPAEVEEFLNAARILFGDESLAILSEMAVCSGEDKTISLSDGSSFNEAIAVQTCSYNALNIVLTQFRGGVSTSLDVGNSEPMLLVDF